MTRQRNHYSADFKAKVALAAIKGQQTLNEVATRYSLHPNLVLQWKKLALEASPDAFSTRQARAALDEEALKAQLCQQIGQLKVELDWMKKKLDLPLEQQLALDAGCRVSRECIKDTQRSWTGEHGDDASYSIEPAQAG